MHTPTKTEHKKSSIITENAFHCDEISSGNDGPLTVHCLVVLLYIQCRQKSLITQNQILCRNKNPVCATKNLVTQQNIFSRSVHTDSSLIWWSTTCTSFNFMLKSLDSFNRDSKNTGHKEDTEIICREAKGAVWHPALTQIQRLLRSQIPHTSLKIKMCNNQGIVPFKNIPSCRYSVV